MSTSGAVVDNQLKSLLYQKGAFGRTRFKNESPQTGEKEIVGGEDPMLTLHQSLATVCARATGIGAQDAAASRYVVYMEVVACHIYMPGAGAGAASKSGVKVWLCKNTTWVDDDKRYVKKLLECLRAIGDQFTESTIRSDPAATPKLSQLTTHIYNHCKDQVRSRIGKLLDAIVSNLHISDSIMSLKQRLERWLTLFEGNPRKESGWWQLADASNYCRTFAIPDGDGTPLIMKRLKKVASYSVSFNNLVTWSLNGRIFLDPQGVTYSPEIEMAQNMPVFDKATLTAHYLPAYRSSNLQALRPLVAPAGSKVEKSYVHAEMYMAPSLAAHAVGPFGGKLQYIGISKPCCFLCYNAIKALKGHDKIVVKGTHNKLYHQWMIPPDLFKDEVKLLETKLDQIITRQVLYPQTIARSADSIFNTPNPHDLDLQPPGPKP